MGIISDVKCSRCDRRYSGLRSRCPYCGASRVKRGKRSSDSDNALWKFIIGILLLVVLIAAVVILLITSIGNDNSQAPENDDIGAEEVLNNTDDTNSGDNVNSIDGTPAEQDDGTTDPNNPNVLEPNNPNAGITDPNNPNAGITDPNAGTVTPTVEVVQITYLGSARTDVTMNVGETLVLGFSTVPTTTATPEWKSSDTSKLTVTQSGELRAVSAGDVTLTVTVGGTTGECVIRVKA